MRCSDCGNINWNTLYFVDKEQSLCDICAASLFQDQLFRLRKRFKKVNKELKTLKEVLRQGPLAS